MFNLFYMLVVLINCKSWVAFTKTIYKSSMWLDFSPLEATNVFRSDNQPLLIQFRVTGANDLMDHSRRTSKSTSLPCIYIILNNLHTDGLSNASVDLYTVLFTIVRPTLFPLRFGFSLCSTLWFAQTKTKTAH